MSNSVSGAQAGSAAPNAASGNAEPDNADLEIKSPCLGVCALDEQDICVGCGRSRLELGQWRKASDEQKLAQLERAKIRMANMQKLSAE